MGGSDLRVRLPLGSELASPGPCGPYASSAPLHHPPSAASPAVRAEAGKGGRDPPFVRPFVPLGPTRPRASAGVRRSRPAAFFFSSSSSIGGATNGGGAAVPGPTGRRSAGPDPGPPPGPEGPLICWPGAGGAPNREDGEGPPPGRPCVWPGRAGAWGASTPPICPDCIIRRISSGVNRRSGRWVLTSPAPPPPPPCRGASDRRGGAEGALLAATCGKGRRVPPPGSGPRPGPSPPRFPPESPSPRRYSDWGWLVGRLIGVRTPVGEM